MQYEYRSKYQNIQKSLSPAAIQNEKMLLEITQNPTENKHAFVDWDSEVIEYIPLATSFISISISHFNFIRK